MSDDSPASSTDEAIIPKVSSSVGKHIYFDEEQDDDENPTAQKIIERPVSSTIRVDSSDLISRCKGFIPLLSDKNQNSTDKNKDDDDDELNLPDIDDGSLSEKSAKESGEASSTTDEEIVKKKRKKKKKKKKKKVKTTEDLNQDVNVNNNQDLLSK
jgi:hypothetical protein